MKDESEKLNITPPEFPDPLLPIPAEGSEGEAKDAYLGEVAKENLADQEALGPEDVTPEPEAPGVPPDNAPPDPSGPAEPPTMPASDSPNDVLRGVVIGTVDPGSEQAVRGAAVEYSPRAGQWRPAVVQRVTGVNKSGQVMVDLTSQTVGGGVFDAFDAPIGSGVGNWRFPLG
jgi:hypothetical protein